ncbi:DNA replication/repair protein RecF [Acidomonas methanolica]|uniref:DNA replication and repair protein RecF n=2 Tax=Acidomonas methanolica TaxID=437 RepID=A0A023D6E8_ACIMT|nr:DNA replication/repair protein RecF [Acidomonas methanolica]MBU2653177.1 DNA replication/repair protein RecF [Acidomonas methanolica]TCS32126.1 DNA replication and repair protein RecF [Acidomonas methanolica]GAJ29396.1 recombination protein RecF [Acidomonas methanolica NBRC 104435]GEK97559.1 DNA replication and repair protein RecF [Acidomonas methanolica NBRC 104435]
MRIDRLVLADFRNYARLDWTPRRRIAVLSGENGAGKTNLLEAVSLLAPGRGLRAAPFGQVQRLGAESGWGIAAWLAHDAERIKIGTGRAPAGGARRLFLLDDAPIRAQSEIAAHFACVWITPQMDRLFTEANSGRRRFLDRLVVALDPHHARETAAHDRAMAQRNRVLIERPGETGWLNALEESVARHAVAVTAARLALIDAMNGIELELHGFPRSDLALDCPIAAALAASPALAVEDDLRARLAAARGGDRSRGSAEHGAQKADLLLSDRITGRSAALSSSGQQKAMLLGVVLAHARVIAERRGQPPALLLDEPLVHLDATRRTALLQALAGIDAPVLLSGTDAAEFAPLGDAAEFVHVRHGNFLKSE